ncbi:hypothetical protein ACTNCE_13845 [Dorea longicatena]|uniref:hypothetical protein n=1 Tax=Dorea longicatena TaxID=88431 RepID=UPI003F8AC39A
MPEQREILNANEIRKFTNELTYRRYLMNKGKIQELFRKMTLQEYIALYTIESERENSPNNNGRTYLKDLSEKMQLTIRQTSKMVEKLKDHGLVLWSYEGSGSEGTYVTVTETGQKLFKGQEMILRECYGKVINKFGKDNLIMLLKMMKQLDNLMCSEIKGMGEVDSYGRADEADE